MALTVLATVTRIPSFTRPLWNPDEGFLATQARILADGGRLYETVVDRKPPLLPWLYQGAFAVFGDTSLWPLKVAAVPAVAATAALVAAIARRRWGDRAGWTAGVLYVLVSIGLNPEDAQAAAFEVFMLPFMVAAVWCADRERWGWAGLAVAGAFLTKQTGGAVALPVLFLLWRTMQYGQRTGVPERESCGKAAASHREPGGRRPRSGPHASGPAARPGAVACGAPVLTKAREATEPTRFPGSALALLSLGFLLPVALMALVHEPGRFLFWTVTGSGSYASVTGITGSELHILGRALLNAAILAAACVGLITPVLSVVLRSGGLPRGSGTSLDTDLWVWLAAAAIGVTAGFHFFGHYYLQLLPPLVLLGTGALRLLPPERLRSSAICSTLSCMCFLGWGVTADSGSLDHAQRVAAAVRQHTAPDEKVLLWGMHPEGYWLASRTPASRYLTAGFLTNFSGGRNGPRVGHQYAIDGSWRTFTSELTARPPALIVDDSRGKPYRPARVPALRAFLATHYEPAAVTDGAVLYVRADPERAHGRQDNPDRRREDDRGETRDG